MLVDGVAETSKPIVSIVVPTFNELKLGYLQKIIQQFSHLKATEKFEFIFVDGQSDDGTREYLKNTDFIRVLSSEKNSSRAMKLNIGIEAAKGEIILCHHPRSIVRAGGLLSLLNFKEDEVWGGYTHRFDQKHWLLKFTSWYSNQIRFRRGIIYLDHCIFFSQSLVDDFNFFPDVDIFEDTGISKKLRKSHGAPIRLQNFSTTSSVRFTINGIFSHSIRNQLLKLAYYFNFSDRKMNKLYERKTKLNNIYD